MKKAVGLLTFSASSLLLAGCEVPEELKQYTQLEPILHWREQFFLSLTSADVASRFLGIIALFSILAAMIVFGGIISNMSKDRPILSGKTLSGLTIFLAIATIVIYLPATTMWGELMLPDNLTIDKVMNDLNWNDLGGLGDVITSLWGFSLTFNYAFINSMQQFVMLLFSMLAVGWSIASQSLKGVAYVFFAPLFWGFNLKLYAELTDFVGKWYPDLPIDVAFVEGVVSGFYTGIVVVTAAMCWYILPVAIAIKFPDGFGESVVDKAAEYLKGINPEQSNREGNGHKPSTGGGLPGSPSPVGGGNGGSTRPSPESDGYDENKRRGVSLPSLSQFLSMSAGSAAIGGIAEKGLGGSGTESAKSEQSDTQKENSESRGFPNLSQVSGERPSAQKSAGAGTDSGEDSGKNPGLPMRPSEDVSPSQSESQKDSQDEWVSASDNDSDQTVDLPKSIRPGPLGSPSRAGANSQGSEVEGKNSQTETDGLPSQEQESEIDTTKDENPARKVYLPDRLVASSGSQNESRMKWLKDQVEAEEKSSTLPNLDTVRSAHHLQTPPEAVRAEEEPATGKKKSANLPSLKQKDRLPVLQELVKMVPTEAPEGVDPLGIKSLQEWYFDTQKKILLRILPIIGKG